MLANFILFYTTIYFSKIWGKGWMKKLDEKLDWGGRGGRGTSYNNMDGQKVNYFLLKPKTLR